jgi:hypothetical protein
MGPSMALFLVLALPFLTLLLATLALLKAFPLLITGTVFTTTLAPRARRLVRTLAPGTGRLVRTLAPGTGGSIRTLALGARSLIRVLDIAGLYLDGLILSDRLSFSSNRLFGDGAAP